MPAGDVTCGLFSVTPGERYTDVTEVTFTADDSVETLRTELDVEVLEVSGLAARRLRVTYRADGVEVDGRFEPSVLHGLTTSLHHTSQRLEVEAGVTDEQRALLLSDWSHLGQPDVLRQALAGNTFTPKRPTPDIAQAMVELLTRGAPGSEATVEAKLHHAHGELAVFEVNGTETQRAADGLRREASFSLNGIITVRVADSQLLEVHLEGHGAVRVAGVVEQELRKSVRVARSFPPKA